MNRRHSIKSATVAGSMAVSLLLSVTGMRAEGLSDGDLLVYDDSYGNLVIESPVGYKQIVVGRGFLADETGVNTGKTSTSRREDVLILAGTDRVTRHHQSSWCVGSIRVIRGRSYMYGVPWGNQADLGPNPC